MKVWKTLRDGKPDSKVGRILVLTTTNRIVPAWYVEERGRFYYRCGVFKRIASYKRWCYEKDLAQQALNEIENG